MAELAKKYGKPVIAFAGSTGMDAGLCNAAGIDAFFPVIRSAMGLKEAMKKENAVRNMADAGTGFPADKII